MVVEAPDILYNETSNDTIVPEGAREDVVALREAFERIRDLDSGGTVEFRGRGRVVHCVSLGAGPCRSIAKVANRRDPSQTVPAQSHKHGGAGVQS